MLYNEKLVFIMDKLGCSNKELANYSSLDPSLVSRYRTGVRVPAKGSRHTSAIANGLAQFAVKENKLRLINSFLNIGKNSPAEHILAWMEEEDSGLRNKKNIVVAKIMESKQDKFSKKLDFLMDDLNLSNIRLAYALDVDPSLISRFRSGMHIPLADNEIYHHICEYFAEKLYDSAEALSLFADIAPEANTEEIYAYLYDWFNSDDVLSPLQKQLYSFFDYLDHFTINNNHSLMALPPMPKNCMAKNTTKSFWGNDGLKQALLIFLSTIAATDKPTDIYLYSGQDIGWLNNESLANTWTKLMMAVLSKGHRLHIVHHISRSVDEMVVGVMKWLPLYMTGKIIPYQYQSHTSELFFRSMCIAPDLCSVISSGMVGEADTIEYVISNEPGFLNRYLEQFKNFLSHCPSFVFFYKRSNLEQYLALLHSLPIHNLDMMMVSGSLSLATMSQPLFSKIIKQICISKEEKEAIVLYYKYRRSELIETLKNGFQVDEMVVLPSDEALFKGNVKINIPELLLPQPIYYTPSDFSLHIKDTINLLNEHKQYSLTLLPVTPFDNLEFILKTGGNITIFKNQNPSLVFYFDSESMCSAF